MKPLAQAGVFQFEGFRLDRQSRVLFRRDEAGGFVPMAVGSRALDVLDVLLDQAGNLVLRDALMAAVWPATAVEDTNLNMQIAAIRRVLDEGRAESSCIQTVPGRGYRFVLPVTLVAADAVALRPSGAPALPLPDKPSIAVLPFANMSGDPEQELFADGITEDVTTALSRYPSLFVIARNSCFTYKGRAVDVKQVGRELGVRYVLEGSLRKAGSRIRVTAQLVEAETNKHFWAERYDRDLANIFAVQDEITEAATIAIAPAIAEAELQRALRKPPGSLDAWAAYQRGLWHWANSPVRTMCLLRNSFGRRSISTRLLPEDTEGWAMPNSRRR
jgi:TolB-like protein